MLRILIVLLFLASLLDFYKGKIPNILVLFGCLYGMVRLLYNQEMLKFIPGILFPFIIMFPLYKIGVLGAGDIKLFSMIGFYFPFMELIYCIVIAFVLGAVISAICMFCYHNFFERMAYLFSYLKECFRLRQFRYYYLDSKGKRISQALDSKSQIHFAIPIFISVLFHIGGIL